MKTVMKSLKPHGKGFLALLAVTLFLLGLWPAVITNTMAKNDDEREVEFIGVITNLPDTRGFIGEWAIFRARVKVTDSTKIDETNGKVAVGAIVEIKGIKQDDGTILATEIEVKLNPPNGVRVTFIGKVDELPSTPGLVGDWKVSRLVVHVTSATKIDEERGQVAVGSVVEVTGLAQIDGSINALEIVVKPDVANGIPVKFLGRVEKLPDARGRIGDWVVSGRTVRVTADTRINQEHGEMMIGSLVEVEGLAQLDGVILAGRIEVKPNVDNPTLFVFFRGIIESLPNTTDFIGDWKVSGRAVSVTADTKIDQERGKVVVGALVEVSGILQADGSVKALKIAVRENPNPPGFIRFIGVIRSLPPSTSNTPDFIGDWTVGERIVHVTADTKIEQEKGRVQVGALVEVEGILRNDRSVDARRIEVKHVFNDTLNYVRFFGTITALPDNNTLIGDWTVGGRVVHVTQRTRIRTEHGAPRIGAFVEVEGNQRSDDSVDAFRIEVERDAGAPEGTIGFINFYGQIKSLPDSQNFVGVWMVNNKTVQVTEMTRIDQRRGMVAVNAFVEVFGYLLGDGSVRAIKIEVRPVPANTNARINRSYIEFIGTVTKLPDTKNYVGDWRVGDRIVHVRQRTVIHRERAAVNVGATVEIIGAELPNGEVDAKLIEVEHGPVGAGFLAYARLTSVNAGSYLEGNAASSIIASFGSNLATTTAAATGLPLPTTLGGVSVLVDGQPAGLFFVSANQINYLAPDGLLPGTAQVTVLRNGSVVAQGTLRLGSIAPSLFTADASGQGAPAGILLRIKVDGEQVYEPLARYDSGQGRFVPVAIRRQAGERLFLVLYGTGMHGGEDIDGNASNGMAENVQVTIGNVSANVTYAGPAPGYEGLNQLNIELPPDASGANITVLVKASDGEGKVLRANGVTISVP